MDFFLQADTWIALLTLTFLEIVLGIDNIIFISIVAGKLPEHQQKKARLIGLTLALVVRIFLLMGITWLIGLTDPVLEISTFSLSWRDIILFVGGLFLIAKSTSEIHHKVEGKEELTVKIFDKMKLKKMGCNKQDPITGMVKMSNQLESILEEICVWERCGNENVIKIFKLF